MSRFLAAFRAAEATALADKRVFGTYGADNPRKGGNPPPPTASSGGGSFRGFRDCGDHTGGKTAFPNAVQAGAEALGTPDPELACERAAIAAAVAAEARGDFGPPATPGRHRKTVAGLLRGFLGTGPQPTLEMLA